MKKKWIQLCLFVCPLLFLLIFINYYIDPANLFHDISSEAAVSLIEGNNTYIAVGNAEMVEVKRALIRNMPEEVECVIIGPSLTLCIDSNIVQTDSCLNLSISGATYYDYLAVFGAMEKYEKKADRVIIGLETSFFDENKDIVLSRYEGNKLYAEYMLQLLNLEGEDTTNMQLIKMKADNIKQLFSLTYFQTAMKLVAENGISYYGNNRVGIVDENYKGAYYQPDGGYVYSEEFQQQDAEYVKKHSEEKYPLSNRITPQVGVDAKSKETLIRLCEYLRSQGTEVEFFVCPFAPSLWDKIDFEEFPIILEMDEFIREYAGENDIKVIGGINPYEFGMTDADFYDARHIRKERLSVYFDFTE